MKNFWKALGICMMAVSENAKYNNGYTSGINYADNEIIKNYVNYVNGK